MIENNIYCNNDEEIDDNFDICDQDCVFEVEEVECQFNNCNDESNNWDFTLDSCSNSESCTNNDCCNNISNDNCNQNSCSTNSCNQNNCNQNNCNQNNCDWDDDCNYECDCDCDCDDRCNNAAELIVEKSVNKQEAFEGEVLKYCIFIKNIGNVSACDIIIKDNLDRCLQYVKGSLRVNNRKTCGCVWSNIVIKTIKPGECVKITFEAVIKNCNVDKVENFVVCCYSYFTDNCSNRVTQKATSNVASTNIMDMDVDMVKSVNKECVRIGEIVKYTVDITNRSNTTIENFVLKDKLNSSLKCLEILSRGQKYNCCKLCSGINLGQIAPGETVSVCIKVRVVGMGENCKIPNKAYGYYTLNGVVGDEIESNTVYVHVSFDQCKEICLKDIVKLSCEMGPAIGIIDSAAKVEIKKVDRIGNCGSNNRIRISGIVKTKYVYDKGYNCHKKVCSQVPFNLILRIPSELRNLENLDLKICLKEICPKIICGYTIESDIKLEVCLKSR